MKAFFVSVLALLVMMPQYAGAVIVPLVSFGSDEYISTSFRFSVVPNGFEFTNIASREHAGLFSDLLVRGPSASMSGGVVTIGSRSRTYIEIGGLTRDQFNHLQTVLDNIDPARVQIYSSVNARGVLTYRVRAERYPDRSGRPVISLATDQQITFTNQNFNLRWTVGSLNGGTCTMSSTNSDFRSPGAAVLNRNGSMAFTSNDPGRYTVTYRCQNDIGEAQMTIPVEFIRTSVPAAVSVTGSHCYIGHGDSQCTALLSWDSFVRGGTVTGVTVRNVTTQTLLSTDISGLTRPTTLRHGTNTFEVILTGVGRDGTRYREAVETTAVASCDAGFTWNGTVCVTSTAAGAWDIISDIGFYGSGYAGMPARNGGSHTHAANSICEVANFWACDVRENQPPVQLEFFVDGELILTDRTNITSGNLTNPWWEGESRYHHTPACGESYHNTYDYRFIIPEYLRDNRTHTLKILATRSDGVSRWVTYNGWNAFSRYPDTEYQNFPFNCSPTTVRGVDLAGFLSMPRSVAAHRQVTISTASVVNMGRANFTGETAVAIQFDFNRNGMGRTNDFTIRTTIADIESGQTVFPNFDPAVFGVGGNWRARLIVDPAATVEPFSASPDSTRNNNTTRWVDFIVTGAGGEPTGTLTAEACVIPLYGRSCDTTVRWSSDNFTGSPELTFDGRVISSNPANLTGRTVAVTPDNRTFRLRDTGSLFTLTRRPLVSCESGSRWEVSACVPDDGSMDPPSITITPHRPIIRYNTSTEVSVEIEAGYALSCEVQGVHGGTRTINHTSGTRIYTFETAQLRSLQRVTVTCDPDPLAEVTESATIEVVASQYEG